MPNIFISYRREDSAAYAGRLYDRFELKWGSNRVFMDIDTLRPGDDFVEVIEKHLADCSVIVAIIGKHWLGATDSSGRRRIDSPQDFLRAEISIGLKNGIRVIPVLVQGAAMPSPNDMPEEVRMLARRHAFRISDERFRTEADRLIAAIDNVFAEQAEVTKATQAALQADLIREAEERKAAEVRQQQLAEQVREEAETQKRHAVELAARREREAQEVAERQLAQRRAAEATAQVQREKQMRLQEEKQRQAAEATERPRLEETADKSAANAPIPAATNVNETGPSSRGHSPHRYWWAFGSVLVVAVLIALLGRNSPEAPPKGVVTTVPAAASTSTARDTAVKPSSSAPAVSAVVSAARPTAERNAAAAASRNAAAAEALPRPSSKQSAQAPVQASSGQRSSNRSALPPGLTREQFQLLEQRQRLQQESERLTPKTIDSSVDSANRSTPKPGLTQEQSQLLEQRRTLQESERARSERR